MIEFPIIIFVIALSIPAIYFLSMALLGAVIEQSDAWKVCASVAVALLIFVAITAP